MGAITVLAIVATAGIIDMEIMAVVDPGTEQCILFRVKRLFVFNENVTDVSTGDSDSPFGQLLQDQRLSDSLMVMLVEDIAPEGGAEVLAL